MKVLKIILLLILAVPVLVVTRLILDGKVDYEVSTQGLDIPQFAELQLPYANKLDKSVSLPFMASAIIDVDNDGVEEVLLGGGPGQADAILRFNGTQFEEVTMAVGWVKPELADTTFGAAVIDTDQNGFSDVVVARTSGVWLYKNSGGKFTATKLDATLKDGSTPLSIALADLNRDGHFDMYVSGYINNELVEGQNIFNKPGYGGSSALFMNNGDDTFTDITRASGLEYVHNTFLGVFIDVDNDSLEDLVVAHDTGTVKTWKNMGNMIFKDMPNPTSDEFGYPMGIAVTDYRNDGLPDFFFSNVGSTPPAFVVTGDLTDEQVFNPKWIFFQNKGQFKFDDVAEEAKLADYEFSWGAIFEDFNLDGRDDLVVSENYIGFPPHKIPFLKLPGRFLLQNENFEFAESGSQSGVVNPDFGITPLTADFNGDGYPDLIHVNLNGQSRAFISSGGEAGHLKVRLPDIVSSIGAKIAVTRADGKILYRDFVSGEGLCSDQSHIQVFGLSDSAATVVSVKYLDGRVEKKSGRFLNETVVF